MTNSISRFLENSLLSRQWMVGDIAVVPVSFFAAATATIFFTLVVDPVAFYRKRRRWLLVGPTGKGKKNSVKKNSNINIGAIFGMDVGGTLTKIVFFQAKTHTTASSSDSTASSPTTAASTTPASASGQLLQQEQEQREGLEQVPRRKSSENLAQLEQPDHQEALQNFYAVMDPEKGALGQSAGVIRDSPLDVYSNFLKGTFHFLHFETRNMMNAIHYVSKATAVSDHIKTMGCTGGGAHKYDAEISEELDIEVHKYDELGCLVRGMLFALNNFPNELYTYRFVVDDSTETSSSSSSSSSGSSSSAGGSSTSSSEATSDKNNNTDNTGNAANTASTTTSSGSGSGSRSDQDPMTVATSSSSADTTDASNKEAEPQQDTVNTNVNSTTKSTTTTSSSSLPPSLQSPSSIESPSKEREKEKENASRWQKDTKASKVYLPYPARSSTFPYLIVNIGSGVSILKVTKPGEFQRVSGSSLGGGTYWGLCRLLIKADKYEDVLDLAESGDAGHVDMLVKDIYGGDYGRQLSGTMVASSFGKLVMKESPREGVKEEDLALALLMMITNNIGQVAYLNAQLHECQRIFFVGSFLRNNQISCRRLAFAIDFWSKGKMEALFLTHEGYLGALGTFLHSAFGDDVDQMLHETERERRDIATKRPFASGSGVDGKDGTNGGTGNGNGSNGGDGTGNESNSNGEGNGRGGSEKGMDENTNNTTGLSGVNSSSNANHSGPIRRLSHNFREWSKTFTFGKRSKSSWMTSPANTNTTTTPTEANVSSSAPSSSLKQSRYVSSTVTKKNHSSDNLSEWSIEEQEQLQAQTTTLKQQVNTENDPPMTPNSRRRGRSSSDDYVYRSLK